MKRTLFISLLLFAASCRPDSVIPDPDNTDPWARTDESVVSVAFLKSLYKGAPVRITGEYRIEGAVVSDDRQGNFYKTLVVDDGTSGGIELKLDLDEIFRMFVVHSRVTVRCNGLWLGSYGGTLQLGTGPFGEYETQYIPANAVAERLMVDTVFHGEVYPRVLTFSQLAPQHISTFAAFEGVRFADEEAGAGWAEEGFDTDRHLVDATGDTLIVRTSRYADFAGELIPAGTGRIEGVLGYFNGKYQLVVCDAQKFQRF